MQKPPEARPASTGGRHGEFVVRKALQKPANRYPAFEPCQAHARALMNAQTKSQVAVVFALQQQAVRLLELG